MKVRNRITAAALSAVIASGVFYAPLPGGFDGVSVVADAATTVAAPKASLKSGTYNTSGSKTVKLSCSTKGAVIWYSVNGGSYKKYTKAITISKNTTIVLRQIWQQKEQGRHRFVQAHSKSNGNA